MDEMNEKAAEASDRSFIYTNWRGKSFVIDEAFAETVRNDLIAEGFSPSDVDDITPESLIEEFAFLEEIERNYQLDQMWEMPVGKTDR